MKTLLHRGLKRRGFGLRYGIAVAALALIGFFAVKRWAPGHDDYSASPGESVTDSRHAEGVSEPRLQENARTTEAGPTDEDVMRQILAATGVSSEEELLQLIAQGAEAKYQEALALLRDASDPETLRRAFETMLIAADAGHAAALFEVASMYERGVGTRRDLGAAFNAYLEAALAGIPEAQMRVGRMLEIGRGTAVDYVTAAQFYQLAASNGIAAAWRSIGQLYSNGRGFPQDYARALELYYTALAAGDIDAGVSIGMATIHGWGIEADAEVGLAFLRTAAEQGSAKAATALSRLYASGEAVGEVDVGQAFDWLKRAAEGGDAEAQRLLARRLATGSWGEKDIDRAIDWFAEAGANGDTQAMLDLATMTLNLSLDEEGFKQAITFAQMAFEYGNPEGAFRLAQLQAARPGPQRVQDHIAGLLHEAADQGNWRSRYAISLMDQGETFGDAVRHAAMAEQAEHIAAEIERETPPDQRYQRAKPISMVSPTLPEGLVVEGFSGSVVVEFIVEADGKARTVVVPNSPNSAVNRAARAAVRQWTFQPALRDGQPVPSPMRMSVVFLPTKPDE